MAFDKAMSKLLDLQKKSKRGLANIDIIERKLTKYQRENKEML